MSVEVAWKSGLPTTTSFFCLAFVKKKSEYPSGWHLRHRNGLLIAGLAHESTQIILFLIRFGRGMSGNLLGKGVL